MPDASCDTLRKQLTEPDNNIVAMTLGRKVHMHSCSEVSLIEERYIIKESEIQSRSRYDQFISSKYVAKKSV